MSKSKSAEIRFPECESRAYLHRHEDGNITLGWSSFYDCGETVEMNEKTFRQLVEVFYDGVIIPHEVFMTMWNTPSCGDSD